GPENVARLIHHVLGAPITDGCAARLAAANAFACAHRSIPPAAIGPPGVSMLESSPTSEVFPLTPCQDLDRFALSAAVIGGSACTTQQFGSPSVALCAAVCCVERSDEFSSGF